MSPWIPWDADAEEIAALHVIRDDIPSSARPAILAWVWDRLDAPGYSRGYTSPGMVHLLQTNLNLNFGYEPKAAPLVDAVILEVQSRGDKILLRIIDFMASWYEPDPPYGRMPQELQTLEYHLDNSLSAVELYLTDERVYRLRRRLPQGVEEAVQAAVDANAGSGKHLAEAWSSATAMEPNTSHAMVEAIRAVDVASGAVVIPKDKKPTLYKAVQVMRDQGDWGLVLQDSDGYPDHREVLIGMMETLAKAQPDRHGGEKPSPLEAQTHVQLAATLVHWFASGAIRRTGKKVPTPDRIS
ncbi:hypothetical protein [Pseudolysinimonas sp.]|jgi:hypothetical protein|uniref:hypothetical protein n=1 Tax=Pseudolysinimonas sp. TaxID=2680009 RepID=UPI003783456D